MQWAFLHTPPLPGAANMAIDEFLMTRARQSGTGVVRVYSWRYPALSLGRHQTARGAFDRERARAHGIGLVRRLTGGRAVIHHREITYSVTAPVAGGHALRDDYSTINQLLLAALGELGVYADFAQPPRRLSPPASAPCFEIPAHGELMLHGRKLVGSAQLREHGAMLQHGSILVHDDQHRLGDVAVHPVPPTHAATLADALERDVSAEEFARHLRTQVHATWDHEVSDLDADAVIEAAQPLAARYESDEWTWRR